MAIFVAASAALFGLVIGSFLNVVVYRVPAGLSVLAPRSACPGCAKQIAWYDNIPVLSWLVLRAKCRNCKESISVRYPIVEASTGALFVLLAVTVPRDSLIPLVCLVGAACLALAIVDFETMRLPDQIVFTTAVLVVAGVILDGFLSGEWPLLRAAESALLWALVFGIPWLVTSGRGMGFGDVKFAPVLGLMLGWVGWGESLVGLFSGFLLGSIIGVLLILVAKSEKRRRIPYGPFMVAGTLVGLLAGQSLWGLYLRTFFPTL